MIVLNIPKIEEQQDVFSPQHNSLIYDQYHYFRLSRRSLRNKRQWETELEKYIKELELENFNEDWFVALECVGINRRLGMSRDLGDFEFKKIGVISEPEIYKFPLDEIDYIILASDGLWNGVSQDDLHLFVSQKMDTLNPSEICQELTDIARSNGSTDDITVVGLFFKKQSN